MEVIWSLPPGGGVKSSTEKNTVNVDTQDCLGCYFYVYSNGSGKERAGAEREFTMKRRITRGTTVPMNLKFFGHDGGDGAGAADGAGNGASGADGAQNEKPAADKPKSFDDVLSDKAYQCQR